MSKVICDVCGTTYPETAAVCPICGCAKNTTEQTGADTAQQTEEMGYTPVKGGRFSKSNVRKRNKKVKETRYPNDEEPENGGANKGLVAVVLILLLAIIAVLGYIGVRFLFPADSTEPSEDGTSQMTGDTTPSGTTDPSGAPDSVPCTELKLSATTVELTDKGMIWMLSTEVQPADTTDTVTFTSSNPAVATVDENGKITAVDGGETVITVTCGEITAQCTVKCSFGDPTDPTTEPTEPDVDVPTGFVLKLKYEDFTISEKYPDPVAIYKEIMGVKATDITWTSDNPDVAKIDEKGVVSAVGKGNTVVRGTYGNQTVSCKVVIAFTPAEQPQGKYKISHRDVTLEIGGSDSFRLTLTTEEGVNVDAQWTANEEGYVEIDGKNIKGVKNTSDLKNRYVIVSATVEDYTYSCIVRVTEKKTEEAET